MTSEAYTAYDIVRHYLDTTWSHSCILNRRALVIEPAILIQCGGLDLPTLNISIDFVSFTQLSWNDGPNNRVEKPPFDPYLAPAYIACAIAVYDRLN